ncbi:MAG: hypothetical protein IJW53_05225 [Clostridia bacterium]|nr:hypothetical protein [Clostridia bacterium]
MKSKLFDGMIGIHINEEKGADEELIFGGLYIGKNEQPLITIHKDLYTDGQLRDVLFLTLMHELGHYFNGDLRTCPSEIYERRIRDIENGAVSLEERRADAFAVRYLGKKRVISGLEGLIKLNLAAESTEGLSADMCVKELELRIRLIKDS